VIINCGALPCLLNLLQTSHKKSIKKEACWTISNITAGTKDQIQAVIDNHILPPLVQLLSTAEFDIKKESAWAISNATSGGTADQIKYLVHAGCVRPLCDLLTCADVRIVTVALEGLENILKVPSPGARPRRRGASAPRGGCRARRASAASARRARGFRRPPSRRRLPQGRLNHGCSAAQALLSKGLTLVPCGPAGALECTQHAQLATWLPSKLLCPLRGTRHVVRAARAQVGEAEKELAGAGGTNPYAQLVDEAEGLDKIEELQNHTNEDIYDKAVNILETFFDVEDGEVENLAPQVDANQARALTLSYPCLARRRRRRAREALRSACVRPCGRGTAGGAGRRCIPPRLPSCSGARQA